MNMFRLWRRSTSKEAVQLSSEETEPTRALTMKVVSQANLIDSDMDLFDERDTGLTRTFKGKRKKKKR
jgi:hypothetical protein